MTRTFVHTVKVPWERLKEVAHLHGLGDTPGAKEIAAMLLIDSMNEAMTETALHMDKVGLQPNGTVHVSLRFEAEGEPR